MKLSLVLSGGDFQIPIACIHKISSSKMAIHDLLVSQSSTHGHLHAKILEKKMYYEGIQSRPSKK